MPVPIRYAKTCHGVLCLIVGKDYSSLDGISSSYGMIFYVYTLNPSTREMKALPSINVPTKPPSESHLCMEFGFGLSKNKAWKIIMLLSFEDIGSQSEDRHQIVMVCSQVEDSWKWRQIDTVPDGLEHIPYLNYTRDCYLNGKYYWLCSDDYLIWFDMDDEIFGQSIAPIHAGKMHPSPARLLAACLAFFLGVAPAIGDSLTAYEILQEYDFPVGILPTGVESYELNRNTGKFAAYFGGSCSFTIKGYNLKYSKKITGTISQDRLSNLSGVQVKILLFWLNIVEVTHKGDNLEFSVGIASAGFGIDNFYESPQCGCGFSCVNKNTSNLRTLVSSS
nr:uncharacterized protein At5g01610-like [Ipomoea trifida]